MKCNPCIPDDGNDCELCMLENGNASAAGLEYIITEDAIRTAHDIAGIPAPSEEQDILFFETLKKLSRPHNPAPDKLTYETCHHHFSCPDGEECWYSSQDYYWDCGNGATRLSNVGQEASAKAREGYASELNISLKNFEGAMDKFLDDTLDPEYIIRERLHIEIESLRIASEHTPCLWTEDEADIWHAACGTSHQFTNGGPAENHYEYCPYCGKIIKVAEGKK